MLDLFVSHATADDAHADRFADALVTQGVSTWIDHRGGLELGAPNWDRAIRGAIKTCSAAVLLMTPRSLGSDICEAECLFVREQGKPFFVAYLENGGEIWLSIKMIQYADLRADFARGVELLARALRGEKDVALPVPVRGKLTGADTMRITLPYLLNMPLTGRDDALSELCNKLGPYVTQIVAVGGSGKSRLAAEIALNYPNGAIWHRCGAAVEAYDLTELIRRHYGFMSDCSTERVLAALDTTPPLIVLDNAEDVPPRTERRATYIELIQQIVAQGAPVLLATRTAWDELVPFRSYELTPVLVDEAAQMAMGFATAEGLSLPREDAATLAAAALNHPRLIEFAVRQLHRRGLSHVLSQFTEYRQSYNKHGRTLESLEKVMDEMILSSVHQMAEQEHEGICAEQLLRRLTVFSGPFDSMAAVALRPEGMDDAGLDIALEILQNWSFLRFDRVASRYKVEEIVRTALPASDDSYNRHFDHFFTLYGDVDSNMDEGSHARIMSDWLEVRGALLWGNKNRPIEAATFASALHYYMQLHVPLEQWRSIAEGTYEATARTNNPLVEADSLQALGRVLYFSNEYEVSLARFERARSLYEALDNQRGQAASLLGLGDCRRRQYKYDEAHELYSKALTVYQEIGNQRGQADTLRALGRLAYANDEYSQARTRYERALSLYRAIGARRGQAHTLHGLGEIASLDYQVNCARDHYGEALGVFKEIGDVRGQANALEGLGETACLDGDFDGARDYYSQALPIFTEIGERWGQANTLRALGDVAKREKSFKQARDYYQQALRLHQKVGARRGQAKTLIGLGEMAQTQQEYVQAREYYEQALFLYEAIGSRSGRASALYGLGTVAGMQHEYTEARQHYISACSLAEQTGSVFVYLSCLGGLAENEQAVGNTEAACKFLGRALVLAESHSFFRIHPTTQSWRKQYMALRCS